MRSRENKTTGFSLMEMLISIVIGMIIVAAASTMLVNILKAQKDITSSARLNQELGAVMAVMSNEIRRAGFSVCSERVPITFTCPEPPIFYDQLGEDIKIDSGGDCIEYRYNADLDDDLDTSGEHRGFRLKDNNRIQMAGSAGNVTCGNDANWVDLTDPDVINITSLGFSTTGSKCLNFTTKSNPANTGEYWVVKEVTGVVQTGLACDNGTTPVDFCTVTGDPTVITCNSNKTVGTSPIDISTDDELFGSRQITITMNAELTKDTAVSKNLVTSVKVVNPWIGNAP